MGTYPKPDPSRTYTTSQVLAMARERIATAETYRPGEAAYDSRGGSVAPELPAAVKWSGWGALEALALGEKCTAAVQLLDQTSRALFEAEFVAVDDTQGHAAVLAVYDAAIARAKAKDQPTNGRQGGLPFAGRDQRPQTTTAAPATGPSNGGAVAVRPEAAVSRVEQLCGIVTDLNVALDRLNELRAHANVCFPAARPDFIAPFHSLAIRTVAIDATRLPREAIRKPGESADFYCEKQSRGWALTKIALDKFAVALGVSWHPLATGRVDDESEPLYCRFRAVGVYLAFDGRELMNTQHKTVDLRPTSAQAAGLKVTCAVLHLPAGRPASSAARGVPRADYRDTGQLGRGASDTPCGAPVPPRTGGARLPPVARRPGRRAGTERGVVALERRRHAVGDAGIAGGPRVPVRELLFGRHGNRDHAGAALLGGLAKPPARHAVDGRLAAVGDEPRRGAGGADRLGDGDEIADRVGGAVLGAAAARRRIDDRIPDEKRSAGDPGPRSPDDLPAGATRSGSRGARSAGALTTGARSGLPRHPESRSPRRSRARPSAGALRGAREGRGAGARSPCRGRPR
ncbi:MAG: hypothetical protein KIT14_13845 [bacterium]|nr:hypothetical protein [bacterium]